MKNFISVKNYLLLLLLLLLSYGSATAQTPGLIITPASGDGRNVLDPNGDGYTSENNFGFISDDQRESEIPFHSLVFPLVEPTSDLSAGPNC